MNPWRANNILQLQYNYLLNMRLVYTCFINILKTCILSAADKKEKKLKKKILCLLYKIDFFSNPYFYFIFCGSSSKHSTEDLKMFISFGYKNACLNKYASDYILTIYYVYVVEKNLQSHSFFKRFKNNSQYRIRVCNIIVQRQKHSSVANNCNQDKIREAAATNTEQHFGSTES